LSIDKDVLANDVVQTNWDQGQFQLHHLERVCGAVHGDLVGSDVCGDVSNWRYSTAWKRWLSRADGQETAVGPDDLRARQLRQWGVNLRLVALLDRRAAHQDPESPHAALLARPQTSTSL
jgi:hypothetical protein